VTHTDAFERRVNASAGFGFAGGSQYLKVLTAGEMSMKAGLVHNGADSYKRLVAVTGHGVPKQ
jgi:hypothetical protein